MTYKQTAQHLANQGRYGDTMLVHMNPREVAGLQYLASKYGTGGLTINPTTGLPEAFNLKSFLPMIAGAALAPFTGGLSAALMVGAGYTAATGNLKQGLMAGLGAYGGAGLASGLASAGATTAAGQGATASMLGVPEAVGGAAAGPGSQAAMLAAENASMGLSPAESLSNIGSSASYAKDAVVPSVGGPLTTQTLAGPKALLTETGRNAFVEGMKSMPYSTAASSISGLNALTPTYKAPEAPAEEPYKKAEPYKRNYVANPNPLQDREWMYFQPNALYVREGGITSLAKGGLEDGGFVLRASTVNGLGNGDTNAGQQVAANKLGARPIKGSGDGMSDSIPTTIGGKRQALVSSGEAYVPRSQVARLGNGDIQKGADKLYKMMDRVEQARTGKKKAPKQINPNKFVPA